MKRYTSWNDFKYNDDDEDEFFIDTLEKDELTALKVFAITEVGVEYFTHVLQVF